MAHPLNKRGWDIPLSTDNSISGRTASLHDKRNRGCVAYGSRHTGNSNGIGSGGCSRLATAIVSTAITAATSDQSSPE